MKSTGRNKNPFLRRVAEAMGEPEEGRLSALLLHHGVRAALLLGTAIAVYMFFPAPRVPDAVVLERGVVAPQDVIADFTFHIPKSEAELARERAEAASGVPPVLDFVPAAQDSMLAGVHAFFATVDSIVRAAPPEVDREAVRLYMERNRLRPTPGSVGLLLDSDRRREVRRSIDASVRELLPRGVTPPVIPVAEGTTTFRVRRGEDMERLVPRDSLLTPDRFFRLASDYLLNAAGADAAELQRLVLIRYFQPSLVYNESETAAARERAREAVDPVRATVLEGERVVGAREQIGEREEERLRAYHAALTERGMDRGGAFTTGRAVGSILYNTLVLLILGVLLLLFRRPLYNDFRAILLLALLVVAVSGAAAGIAWLDLPAELIPVTFAALIVAALWDGRLGLILALTLALLIGGQSPFLGVSAPFSVALGGAAAAFSVRVVQRRSQTWIFVSIISAAYAAAAITMGMMRAHPMMEVLGSMGWGVVNAVVASLLAIGFLPLLESFTRITTPPTLLELSDLNRRLLKRLSLEASGTYHHTINVANLTEAACHAIGANGLLARVGAYYHDIGKLIKPHFFIENQPRGRNPHDKLKPSTSAGIIRNHVTEGLKMADEERLPGVLKQFIAEHHGTQQISFFYDRACELDPESPPSIQEFSYPGPKPQSKETAVLMIADSVESASRVLQDPTPDRIRDLVDRITDGKIAAGQLDESPLTLRDIQVIKDQFTKVLTGMYHHRIDYPTPVTLPETVPSLPAEAPEPTSVR